MTLKLRNGIIMIDNGGVPAPTAGIPIYYDFELGTNHYHAKLYINGECYEGNSNVIALDTPDGDIPIRVELVDTHDKVIRFYEGVFKFLNLCVIGDANLFDIYTELQRLYEENQRLKEKGDVV